MMKALNYGVLAAAGLLLAGTAAQAQQSNQNHNHNQNQNQNQNQSNPMSPDKVAEWQQNAVYGIGGLRAEYLISEEVFGAKGNEIGNVENAIISNKGQIVALVIEVGGFWDIADTDVVVPWDKVKLIPDGFKVPVHEDNYEDYMPFGDKSFVTKETLKQAHAVNETVTTGAKTWKLTALLDDYVAFENGAAYGYLDDVIFSKKGEIKALIVDASAPGYDYNSYAFPFYGYQYGWRPYMNVYTLPYGPNDVLAMDPFDYGLLDGYWY